MSLDSGERHLSLPRTDVPHPNSDPSMQINTRFLLLSFFLVLASNAGAFSIDFESETVGDPPAGWTFDGDSSTVRIAATTSSGDYAGGQAIRTDDGGASYAGFALPPLTITSIQADFRWDYAATPTLIVYAWDDANANGFQASERTIGFGLDNDGQFELNSEAGELAGTVNFQANIWYRLTMTWSEPDGSGNRLVSVSGFDLTNSNDLGVVASASMSASDFGVAPSEWEGIAFRMTRGTIDNIQTTSETGAAYTYIDATPANTTLNTDPAGSPAGVLLVPGSNYVDDGTSGSGTDNLWTYRTDAGFSSFEGGTAFESDSGSSTGDQEATDDLITTINLPMAGTYEIVAVFTKASDRDIAAKIGASPQSGDLFTAANALSADQAADPTEINFNSSFTNSRGSNSGVAYLGTITTTSDNEDVRVFVNGLESTPAGDNERTQYEGIAYRSSSIEEPPPTGPKHRDVFLLAGQSNADGRGLSSELTGGLAGYAGSQPDILIHYSNLSYTNSNRSLYQKWVTLRPGFSRAPGYNGSLLSPTFGMEIGAGKILSEYYPNPAFIKVTEGGTALGNPGIDWYPAPLDSPDVGRLYKELIEATQTALAELETTGDTYTVHGLFWHQGESDVSRTAEYNDLMTTLIEGVRRDLGMPNLRFIIGELASTKAQTFRDVQWEVARNSPNSEFISSSGLTTFEGTHFDTPSMITFGERVGYAFRPDRNTLDFEQPISTTGALDRQDEWSAASALEVVATLTQGEYSGGQAAGHPGSTGTFNFNRRNLLPLAGARSMQAEFFAGEVDSALLIAGWGLDAGVDGQFSEAETAIGLGLDSTGTFRIQIGAQSHLASAFTYQAARWYRLTLNWSESDASGQRTVQLFARDLAGAVDLNGGNSLLDLTVTSAEFNGNPANWSGLGGSASRGLIDNVQVSPPGFTTWSSLFYPTLSGGALDDDDQDGIVNAIEFAFGLNPLSFTSSSDLPQPVYGLDFATISFAPQSTQPGILYQVEWSRDLVAWNLEPGTLSGGILNFTIPTADEAIFIRHRVTLTE